MTNYSELVEAVRQVYNSGRTKSLAWRKQQMKGIITMIKEQGAELEEALRKDLHKNSLESKLMEIEMSKNEAIGVLDNLDEWAAPEKVKKTLPTMMDTCYIKREPYGVVLVMGAWNYPVQLTLCPIIGALAAGNCVILKPSEISAHTAALLEKILPKYLDKEAVVVVNGGIPETSALLRERFDYIFYTGAPPVGKIVMEAAAKYLTPVTLELGGKSPCYVDRNCNLEIAAHRILWGRFANAGQTCIAPDYVICEKSVQDKLVEYFKKYVKEFYGEDPKQSKDFGRIVNNRHFHRVKKLMDSGRLVIGGDTDESENYIAPTVMADVKQTEPAMQEEIFGPLLPMMTVSGVDEAISFITSREKPLALYIFCHNRATVDKMLHMTSSGGVCVNDVLMQGGLDTLPFGGVGNSGMGSYHGKFSFETFSHRRSCMIKSLGMERMNSIRYPPYTEKKAQWLQFLMGRKPKSERSMLIKFLPIIILGVIVAIIFRSKL